MARIRMHADEILTDAPLLRALLREQFPDWAGLPIEPVASYGTDHDIYRVGAGLSARLPRVARAMAQAAKEAEWLPRLAPHLPLALPAPVAIGRPGAGYPFRWSILEWLPGENANGTLADRDRAAEDLAAFIRALRAVDTAGAHARPTAARGAPLVELDDVVRRSIAGLGARIDGAAALACWEAALAAPVWDGPERWLHGDLLPGNLIVVDGRLAGVIDFGSLHVGDPACDLQPAWNVFAGGSRARFREALAVDDASWLRGQGWTLFQAVTALDYYWDTNPGMVRQASNAVTQLLGPGALSG